MSKELHYYICHYKPNVDRRNYLFQEFVDSKRNIRWITEYDREMLKSELDRYYTYSEQDYYKLLTPQLHILIGSSVGLAHSSIPWQELMNGAVRWVAEQGDAWRSRLPSLRPKKLSAVDVAIWLAHRRAWQCIVEENIDFGCVFEDDVILRRDSLQKLDELIPRLPDGWDYVDIAGGAGLFIREEQPVAVNLYRIDPSRCRTVCGYLISRKLCEQILNMDCPITMPIDWQLNYFLLMLQAQVYWVEPSIFIHGSEMGYYSNSRKKNSAKALPD